MNKVFFAAATRDGDFENKSFYMIIAKDRTEANEILCEEVSPNFPLPRLISTTLLEIPTEEIDVIPISALIK
jgi:hypothetical protein